MADRIIDSNVVEVSAVASVLGTTTLDVATLCTHENINIFSYNKPVRHHDLFASRKNVANWQQGEGADVGYLEDTTCGLLVGNVSDTLITNKTRFVTTDGKTTIDISNDTTSFLYKLAKGTTGNWVYQRPEGLSKGSPYRIDDFRGYNHDAINPMPSVQVDLINTQSNISNVVFFLPEIPLEKALTNISLDSLKLPMAVGTPSLRNLYYGILFYNDSLTDCFWASQTADQKNKELTLGQTPQLTFNHISWRAGRYNARVFFSNVELIESSSLITNASGIRLFLPSMDTPKVVMVYNGSVAMVTLHAEGKELSGNHYPQVEVTNNRPFAINISSVIFKDVFGMTLQLDPLTPIGSIEPLKSKVFRASIGAKLPQAFTVTVVADGETFTAEYKV